ncbi:uroporphyrinogen-III synthase [Longispora sp. NPDC051575]|uniref:uroporphyrinogen-III synthase n=1 Tax=Longispora sp. NPDC051575 TaxID=3154943 RepID=UPI003417A8C8
MTAPLEGFTVAVTADRRRGELATLLERRGARVVSAPAITLLPLADDAALHEATAACVDNPPDLVVCTTGIGFRGWLEAAEGWGLPLLPVLGKARLIARGPKARGAIRAAGLVDWWHAESECCEEVQDHLLAQGVAGQRIAVQLHGEPQEAFVAALRAAGAEVVIVPVYRWELPEDVGPVRRLVEMVLAGQVDAVTFTSAPAVSGLLQVAGADAPGVLAAFGGRADGTGPGVGSGSGKSVGLARASGTPGGSSSVPTSDTARGGGNEAGEPGIRELSGVGAEAASGSPPWPAVLAACVGPVTAGLLRAAGAPTLLPDRARLGSLVRAVTDELPRRARRLTVGGGTLELRGHAVLLDGHPHPLAPAPMSVLRVLAEHPGRVVSRTELLAALPRGMDGHAVEMAVARLRGSLGSARYVQTVIKRGYRLRVE